MTTLLNGTTVVFGFGVVGRATTQALLARGATVRVAQRKRPADLPGQVAFVACDALDAEAVRRAAEGASQIVVALGFPYDSKVWKVAWPKAMTNFVAACAANGARMVFVDNLYMLGPQCEPLREDMPLTAMGAKPAVLSEVTRIWMAAAAQGRARIAALRCTDFYGPHVAVSHLGATAFEPLARGRTAMLIAPPDTPHDFVYVPDIARAVVTLLDASDDDYGQVWNVPCAPTRTPRELLRMGADALQVRLKVMSVPLRLLPLIGLVSPFMREVADVSFTFDRPYVVDGSKFTKRFWSDVTPYEVGVAATALSFAGRPLGKPALAVHSAGGS